MITVVPIVEGEGEVQALPTLLRRLAQWRCPQQRVAIGVPIRVAKDRFLSRPEDARKHLLLAAAKAQPKGVVLIVLDADDSCPAYVGEQVLALARSHIAHVPVGVVLPNREFEAWFIAAAPSLHGVRGFTPQPSDAAAEAEKPRNAKGWVQVRMGGKKYGEVADQAAFCAVLDLAMAHERSRSFRKLCSEWDRLVTPR